MCDNAEKNCPTVWLGVSHRLSWSFEDLAPFEGTDGEKLAKFREIRDKIEHKVQAWLEEQSIL